MRTFYGSQIQEQWITLLLIYKLNLQNMREHTMHPCIMVANNTSLPIYHIGNSIYSSSSLPIHLNGIIHSPSISKNLLSINKLCRDNTFFVVFDASFVTIKDRRGTGPIAKGKVVGGLFQLHLDHWMSEVNNVKSIHWTYDMIDLDM